MLQSFTHRYKGIQFCRNHGESERKRVRGKERETKTRDSERWRRGDGGKRRREDGERQGEGRFIKYQKIESAVSLLSPSVSVPANGSPALLCCHNPLLAPPPSENYLSPGRVGGREERGKERGRKERGQRVGDREEREREVWETEKWRQR